jgi:flagellin-like protein
VLGDDRSTVGFDDRGVSPIIGTIIMVSIVVILAATVTGVLFTLGDVETAEQAVNRLESILSGIDFETLGP